MSIANYSSQENDWYCGYSVLWLFEYTVQNKKLLPVDKSVVFLSV